MAPGTLANSDLLHYILNDLQVPLTGYGASIESSGSSSLLASGQVGENNHSEAARANDNVGNINLVEAYRAYLGDSGSGSLLTSDQVRQNGYAEATRDNNNLGSINLPQGYGAFTGISGSSNMLTSNQVGENNRTEFARDNDHMENINLLEVFPFQTAGAALDFVKRGAAKDAEVDLVLVEVNLNIMAPGTSANSDLLHYYILSELQVPLTGLFRLVDTMCSCDDEEALSKCMNLGACFHVLKPLDRRSFSILWHQALEHKSKKAAPQGPTLNSTRNGMVSSSIEKPKEVLILERNDLSDPESNGYEEPKKWNRITWTIELHEKFLEAIEALGGGGRVCYT
ncbi:two-component response regulator ORR24-like isoform X2 [Miscanthus floridulus]|uniref:two-component response regulator ORR24-like isoform X2 n=1 Tax=Miscanthus floridulus TaxID=154761 RepID=UPI00345B0B20